MSTLSPVFTFPQLVTLKHGPSATSYYYSTDLDADTSGNREASVEGVKQPFGWTGREYDRVTGLYHHRRRDYDPNTGRFMQEDPIWRLITGTPPA